MKGKILTLIGIVLLISLACMSLSSAVLIESVTTNPEEIAPGETSFIKLGIENNGKEDIEDVSVVLDLRQVPFAPYDSSSEFGIDEIRKDRLRFAEFEIIALNDAASGIYKIPVEIIYHDDDGNLQPVKRSLISITVSSKPIIGVSVEDGLLLKGKENELIVKVTNKGLSDAKFLEIEVGSSTYSNVLSSKSTYIGDIDSDDFDTAKFKIFFRKNSPSTIRLPVTVLYKDSVNNKYEENFNLELKVYSEEKAIELGLLEKSRTTTYIIVVVVIVIIWFVYRRIKKRRRAKKASS
jgi:hypothetical protein